MTKGAITTIKTIRVEIDRYINSFSLIMPSREVSLAHTNMQRSKMWLGKALAELGTATPYKTSEDATILTIDPQAEHTDSNLSDRWKKLETQTERVKDFRQVCQLYIDHFKEFIIQQTNTTSIKCADRFYQLYLQQSFLAVEEAKMWLGWELNRIYELQKKTDEPSEQDGKIIKRVHRQCMD